jgi:hypothetical protein
MAAEANATSSSYWDYLFTDLADPRTNDWPLIKSPVPGLTIIATYLYFCLNIGPKYMANRKPFQMQNTLIIYNFIQVLVSLYITVTGIYVWSSYSWRCQPVDFSRSKDALMVLSSCNLTKYTPTILTISLISGGRRLLHLFYCKNIGIARHCVLRSAKERQSDFILAHVPPHCHADDLLGVHEILPRRTWNIHWYVQVEYFFLICSLKAIYFRRDQFICTYHHVYVLYDGCHGSTISEIFVVEEVYYEHSNGE